MKKRVSGILALTLLLCLLVTLTAPVCYAEGRSYKDVKPGVVRILASNDPLQNMHSWGTGSGFGVGVTGQETDVFITNRHVVTDDDAVCRYVWIMLDDGAISYQLNSGGGIVDVNIDESLMVRCEVLYPTNSDPEFPDVAVIRAERPIPNRVAVPLKSGFYMESGDRVYTMGFPGSADDNLGVAQSGSGYVQTVAASTETMTVAEGVISRTVEWAEIDGTTVFQHTAQSNHGNSGCPLVSEDGYVVGIHTYGLNRADNGVSEYRLALYVDYAMQKLDALGIYYDRYTGETQPEQSENPTVPEANEEPASIVASPLVIAGIAGAVVILVLLSILLAGRKKRVAPAQQAPAWRLQGEKGVFAGKRYAITGTLRLGRDPQRSDLIYPRDTQGISGAHCRLVLRGSELVLIDSGSSYGTFLNGRKLAPETPAPVKVGDRFWLAGENNSFVIDVSHHA